ncbi:MAG: hypothetical protein OXH99_07890 [Bryobacterales bacterium]|nr:hypothetical protein [Bryobacterales bacterium]
MGDARHTLPVAAAILATLGPAVYGQHVVEANTAFYACKDREFMLSVKEAATSKDEQAMQIAVIAMIVSSDSGSECVKFEKGDRMMFIDSEILSGLIVVRKRGMFGRYYSFRRLFGPPISQ